ncbi:hypothetical protein B0F90DRAFT_1932770 [Multifurca ochricompacta]|uniref:Uncharacterized protein n=1 Tax=Multifurca ochricompacta TaxID=376703 RepID=A0AAD4QPA6_9AGAM|nr:hypothetical protein B0F90DRAFT_1932770 [Multifurca ochricompacta]
MSSPLYHSQRRRLLSSRSSAPSGESIAGADATIATVTGRRTQKRLCSEGSGSAFSSSSLSSVDGTTSSPASPQRPDGRQHEQASLHGSPQSRGADHGPLVWVRVTKSGKFASSERDDFEESFWWPACITEGRSVADPLTVSLFGEISPAAPRSLRLETPSSSHILPFKRPGQDVILFSSATFRCLNTSSRRDSFSKRPRTVMDEAWRSAVNLAHEADANLNDGLPSNLSSYRVRTVRVRDSKAEKSMPLSKVKASANGSETSGQWSPPPCDPLLEIPGELVFSLEKKGKTEYWAARVEQYLPPRSPSVLPKYRVRFKDDSFRTVSRDMFYTSDEPEFYTCRLGRYESDEEQAEADSDDEHISWETVTAEHAMPPPNHEDFCELPIREQFAYVKPVIKAVLNETYLPARERHEAFMQGGPSRLRLRKTATGKGDLTALEVTQLGKVLQCWVLGPVHSRKGSLPSLEDLYLQSETGLSTLTDVQVEKMICPASPASPTSNPECKTLLSSQSSLASLSTDIGPSVSMQQMGSPSYEALSEGDKLQASKLFLVCYPSLLSHANRQYCLLVLFHEATLQLLLWRSGERRSPDLLSQADEERLRLVGLAKSEERAWVEAISRMRGIKTRRSFSQPSPASAAVKQPSSGRTLRPRNPPLTR